MARKRWRTPIAKPGELIARYGKARGDAPDLLYSWGGSGATKSDSRIIMSALEEADVFRGRSLREELESRGYDIETLRFSVMLKEPPPHPDQLSGKVEQPLPPRAWQR